MAFNGRLQGRPAGDGVVLRSGFFNLRKQRRIGRQIGLVFNYSNQQRFQPQGTADRAQLGAIGQPLAVIGWQIAKILNMAMLYPLIHSLREILLI